MFCGASWWRFNVRNPIPSASRPTSPDLSSPRWHQQSRRYRAARVGFTRSNSTATGFRSTSPTRRSRFSPGVATIGPIASRRSPTMPGTSSASSAIIDGEIVVPAADGTTDFSVLQNELKGSRRRSSWSPSICCTSTATTSGSCRSIERKAELKKMIAGTEIQFCESFEIDGTEMFKHACKVGLEGVVSKVRDSVYPARAQQRLGQEDLRAARDADNRRLCPRRKQMGRHLSRPAEGQRPGLCRQGRPWLRQDLGRGPAEAADAAGPEDAALRQADRAQGHLGRAEAAGRDRVPGEVGRGKGPAPVLQGPAGGHMSCATIHASPLKYVVRKALASRTPVSRRRIASRRRITTAGRRHRL